MGTRWYGVPGNENDESIVCMSVLSRGLGGVVVIDAAIGAHGCGSRPAARFEILHL